MQFRYTTRTTNKFKNNEKQHRAIRANSCFVFVQGKDQDESSVMSIPISVKASGAEGVIELSRKDDKLEGNFTVALNSSVDPGRYILYRLRVKELTIVFSKTYGLLFRSAGGGANATLNISSHSDSMYIYADLSLSSGHLSTIRVEYLDVSAAEAASLMQNGIGRSTCRPYFLNGKESTYDVKCIATNTVSTYPSNRKVIYTLTLAAALTMLAVFATRKLSLRD
ncbi:unnamed protein product [Phytomonas sp. EM1]|nr:unnamed protein product [Phytomonas sp. EM1]|eukprot:CCW64912.1 unnamed protein product [Phytomonas sp. isolate EM1]